MLSKIQKEKFATYFGALALVLCGLIFLNSYYQYTQLDKLKRQWQKDTEENYEAEKLLSQINQDMGFGGFIHYIEKYVISKNLQNKLLAIAKAENSLYLLNELEIKLENKDLTATTQALKKEIETYLYNLNSGNIEMLNAEDTKAVQAIENLSNHLSTKKQKSNSEHSNIIKSFQEQIIYSSLAVSLLLICLIYLSLLKVKQDHLKIEQKHQILSFVQDRPGESWWTWEMLKDEMNVSKSFWKNLGYKKYTKKINFSEWQELVHPDDLSLCMEHFKTHWESEGNYPIQQTLRFKHKSGHWIHFHSNIAVIEWSKDNSPVKMMGAHSNVNKLVVTQQELAKEKERKNFYEKLSAVSHLAGSIAHEINNPLAILSGHNHILKTLTLKNRIETKTFLESIETMDQTILRIGNIIKSLRSLTRDSSQAGIENFSLKALIDEVIVLCQDRASRSDCFIDAELTQGIKVTARRSQLGQVFINMFNNSFYALRELKVKWIKIEALDLEDKTIIYFTDSGEGIPEKYRGHIMDTFFTTKKSGESTGIGLSTNKSIIDLHKGEYYLNTDSENTCFVIELPKVMSVKIEELNQGIEKKIPS